ncbi:MAG: hypothetical protein EO766_17855 [Hydrotalea sp. AMD]|uniref:hypothetical protein n=1 Tax=Hydrotalea sp. AMD TaxID=2501297 RepID=UPI0010256763|nr:hypothetical protein [Hydrotalea sp. AMD]RWZ83174.1 MAG: hypothetical protein EO766_17855 [Hydrotalea sp. AMD]
MKLKEGAKSDVTHVDAVKVFKSLSTVHKDCKPFVFLMSSLKTVLPEKRELFRRDAELFQSEFEDLDKAIFTNGDELSRVLGSYTQSLELLGDLRDKMKAFQGGIEGAAKKVMHQLRALDLADYFVLYHNTIAVEKIKLGSYVVEMLLEFLAHEVEGQGEVWDLARSLDQLELKDLPRARFGVTHAVSRLYSANMMHSEAMLRSEEAAKEGPAQGYFFTGDIFVDAQAFNLSIPDRAYAIVTPACDLVRPEKLKERTLLVCEGSVRAVNPGSSTLIAKDGLPITVMNNLRNTDQFIAIEWNKKKLHTWHEAEQLKFSDPSQCSLVRVGRLRSTYALQLQRAITSDLSRVGTQRPPSALVPHQLRCFVSDSIKWHEVYFDLNTDAAALTDSESSGKKHTLFVLTDSTIHKVFIKIDAWIKNNPNVVNKVSIEKILKDDVRNALRGYKQKVPQPKKPGDKVDVTAYPLEVIWTGVDQKLVAMTRAGSGSIYSQIADGHTVNGTQN